MSGRDLHDFAEDRGRAQEQCDALFVERILQTRARRDRTVLVGLCGAQGSGKSTSVLRLRERLVEKGRSTAVLSLDDVYRTKAEREALARDIHPLLRTRGVPGTHDVGLAASVIFALQVAGENDRTALPVFDKTIDDRAPHAVWPIHRGRCEVILLEGWCVGARPQDDAALAAPVNALERDEDVDGRWRRYANAQLRGAYGRLFAGIDLRLFLRAPDFDCVFTWRAEQEAKLQRTPGHSQPAMDAAALRRFIAHYERLTRWLLTDEPAHLIVEIDRDRTPLRWRDKGAAAPGANRGP